MVSHTCHIPPDLLFTFLDNTPYFRFVSPPSSTAANAAALMTQMPRFVYLRPSSIPGAGMGVWAQEPIPAGTRFGPYTGNNVNSIGYAWKVSESYGYSLFADRLWLRLCAERNFSK